MLSAHGLPPTSVAPIDVADPSRLWASPRDVDALYGRPRGVVEAETAQRLMNESISRAAGATHGQEMTPRELEAMIRAAGRPPAQRTTLYELAEPRSYVPASISCDAVDCA